MTPWTAMRALLCPGVLLALVPLASAGTVTVSPAKLTFGNQTLGSPSAIQTVTLTNGQTKALSITSITSTLPDYSQTSNCPFSPSTLATGASCTISVTFTPSVLGVRSATLDVNDGASNSPQKVTLTGTGIAAVTVTPTSLPFGNIIIGKQSGSLTATVTNKQTTALTINSITTNLGDYTDTSGCPLSPNTLAAGKTCTILVTFTPAAAGLRSGTLTVNTSAGAPTVSLSGTGLAPAAVNPSALTFAGQALGTTSPGQTVTLTNNQHVALKITSITSSATDFGYTTNCPLSPSTLAAGAICTATVTFSPAATGTRTGTLSFNDNASNTPQTVSLTGTGNPAALVSIAVTPTNPSFAIGTTQQLAATGTYSDGSTLDITTSASWSTGNPAIATVNATGLAASVAVGTTSATATSGSISGSTTLTVTPLTLVSIAVTPALPNVPLGTTQQFTATGTFTDGSMQNITGTVQWNSDTSAVATISNQAATAGLATTVAQGMATISATSGSVSASTTLTVSAASLVSIAITPATPSIALGTTQQFTATGTYTDGSTQNLTAAAVWSSGTPATATINSSGLAQSVAIGTANISATSGTISSSTELTVTTATLVSIAINPQAATIPLGTTQQFTATGTYSDGTSQDVTKIGQWTSSVATVATISNTTGTAGLASTLGTGTTTIGISSGAISSTATLVVNPAALVSIAINPQNPTITLGTTQQFTATGTYTDSSTQDLTSVAIWSSSNATVAIISNTLGSYGLATSAGAGATTITANSGTISASTLLTVTTLTATLVSIAVTPTNTSIASGSMQQFAATGTYSDSSTQDLTTSVNWSALNPAVLGISNQSGSDGLATGLGAGTTTVTATLGAVSGSTTVSVYAVLTSITLTSSSFQIVIGATQQLAATGNYSDGSTQDVTSSAVWTSTNPSIAGVTAGLVIGQTNGIVSITASLSAITSPPSSADIGTAADFYVATNGNDTWAGTLWNPNPTNTNGPFATIGRAQSAVQAILRNPNGRTAPIIVMIRGGNYYQQALAFTSADSGSSTLMVNWQNYPNETPLLSGGMVVTGWTSIGNGAYEATLPKTTKYFENLFYNGGRRLRPRVGGGVGTYKRIAGTVYVSGNPPPAAPPQPNCNAYVPGSGWECFDRFTFSPGDISSTWANLNPPYPTGDIELVAFEWWSAPKMRILSVDTTHNIVYLTGETSPVVEQHGFIANHRYIVENVKDLLTQGGQWFLDLSTAPWTLTYIAKPNENPLTDLVVVPQSTQVWTGSNLSYVTFTGITFEHDNFTVPSTGYVSSQQEPTLTGALSCYNCQHVTFSADTIAQTSGSGIEFKTTNTSLTTAYNTFQNGALYDIGGVGIRVGAPPLKSDTDAEVPQFTTIQNNLIEGYARVYPSGIGIVQGTGHDNNYTHNDIYDGYHSGIEVCLPPSCAPGTKNSTGSFNNVVSFNHIFDLYEGVTDDGGAIYFATGGLTYSPAGNKILNNKIHDTSDASIVDSDGYGGDGINLDSSTGLITIENNLLYRISGVALNQSYGPQLRNMSNSVLNNIFAFARNGMIGNGDPYPTNVCPASPVIIFNASNNIFYFDRVSKLSFYLQQGCEYSCGFPLTDMHNWQSNLYWRTDGKFSTDTSAFHNQPNPASPTLCGSSGSRTYYNFAGWQGLGEDAGSLANTNPGFNHPVYPYDDYRLPNGSPGVGFVVFDPTEAGRSNPLIKPTDPIDIPATFPTATFSPTADY